MGEPATPGGQGFAAGAAASLAPVAQELEAVRSQVGTGDLQLDQDAARKLLASLAEIHARVHRMIARSSDLDVSLRLGQNIVGEVMSERLRGAASGGTKAAIPVLERFGELLYELETTIRTASGIVEENEHEYQAYFQRAVSGLEQDGAQ